MSAFFGSSVNLATKVRLGLGISGSPSVLVDVVDGQIDVKPLCRQPSPAGQRIRQHLVEAGLSTSGRADLVSVMLAFCPIRGDLRCHWFLSQLLHYCGLAMDGALVSVLPAAAPPPPGSQTAGPRRAADVEAAHWHIKNSGFLTGARRHGAGVLAKYWQASNRFMARAGPRSVACDAARIGGQDMLASVVLAFVDGRSRALWAPPQARR